MGSGWEPGFWVCGAVGCLMATPCIRFLNRVEIEQRIPTGTPKLVILHCCAKQWAEVGERYTVRLSSKAFQRHLARVALAAVVEGILSFEF